MSVLLFEFLKLAKQRVVNLPATTLLVRQVMRTVWKWRSVLITTNLAHIFAI